VDVNATHGLTPEEIVLLWRTAAATDAGGQAVSQERIG